MKKIDIITLHRVVNYGSVLQTYALQKKLEEKGNKVEIIDYYPERLHILGMAKRIKDKSEKLRNSFIWRNLCRIIMFPSYIVRFRVFKNFLKKYINLTDKTYYTTEQLQNNIPEADIYCTGSDQVWNSRME